MGLDRGGAPALGGVRGPAHGRGRHARARDLGSFAVVVAIYAVVGTGLVLVLRAMSRRWREGKATPSPGPTRRAGRSCFPPRPAPHRPPTQGGRHEHRRRADSLVRRHLLRRLRRRRLRRRLLGPDGRRRKAGRAGARAHRSRHGAGLGGQQRLADLRAGRAVDRVPARVRRDHLDALPAAGARRGGDRAARIGVRLPRGDEGAERPPPVRRHLRAVVGRDAFFLGAGFGAIASGRVRADATVVDPMARISGWLGRRRSWSGSSRCRAPPSSRRCFWCSTRAGWTSRSSATSGGGRSAAGSSRARWRSRACSSCAAMRRTSSTGCCARGSRSCSSRASAASPSSSAHPGDHARHAGPRRGRRRQRARGVGRGAVAVHAAHVAVDRGRRRGAPDARLAARADAHRVRDRLPGARAAVRARSAEPAAAGRGRGRRGARQPHRVVIVGGGFGGLFAARALGFSPVDVTLVDREPHHLFQPMLYQVATGLISEGEIAPPLRQIMRFQQNAAVLLAEVIGFDLQRRESRRGARTGRRSPSLTTASSSPRARGNSYFGHDELAEHAPGMKTLDDALRLRSRPAAGARDGRADRGSPKRRAGG